MKRLCSKNIFVVFPKYGENFSGNAKVRLVVLGDSDPNWD